MKGCWLLQEVKRCLRRAGKGFACEVVAKKETFNEGRDFIKQCTWRFGEESKVLGKVGCRWTGV